MTARDRHTEASSTGYDDSGHDTQPERCQRCEEIAGYRSLTCAHHPAPSSPPPDDSTPLDPEVLTQLRAAAPEVLAALVSSGPVAKARNEAGRSSMPITLDDYAWLAAAAAAFTDLLAAAEDATRARAEVADVVAALDAMQSDDPEGAHDEADGLLLNALPPEVRQAYRRLIDRCDWWASA